MKKYNISFELTSDEIDQLRAANTNRMLEIDRFIECMIDLHPTVKSMLLKEKEFLDNVNESLSLTRLLQTTHEAPSVSELRG